MFITKMIVAVIMTEALSEILSSGAVFASLRQRLWGDDEKNGRFMGVAISCGYCLSFWFGILMSFALNIQGELPWLKNAEPLIWGIVSHRGANLGHGLWSTLKKTRDAVHLRIVAGAK